MSVNVEVRVKGPNVDAAISEFNKNVKMQELLRNIEEGNFTKNHPRLEEENLKGLK